METAYLTQNKASILTSFNKFKTSKNYMGVYFDQTGKTFITFSNIDNFSKPNMTFGRKTYTFCCIFECNRDFEEQFLELVPA